MFVRASSQSLCIHMFENSYFNIQDIFVGYFVTSISVSAFSGGGGGESKTPKCTDSIANIFDPFSEGGKTTKRNGVPGEGAKRRSGGRVWKGLSPSHGRDFFKN